MTESSAALVVLYDKTLESILQSAPDRAVELILQEHKLAVNQAAFVAALVAKLCLERSMHTNPQTIKGAA